MKKIIKYFNNSIQRTIFKVQNKTNNNFNISVLNKYLIAFIIGLFIYLFYLLLPLMYNKTWVQKNIESKLLNEFRINLNASADITYRILPAPHFLIKDSKINMNDDHKKKSIAEIKVFQVFLSQANFFNKEKMNIKKIVINNANFTLLENNIRLLKNFSKKNFSNKKIIIKNSNIFFKNKLKEVIFIIKVESGFFFFDNKQLLNLLNLEGEVFNIPFDFNFQNRNDDTKYEEVNLDFKSLKLDVFNQLFIDKDNLIIGENIISFLKNKIKTKYNIEEKLIIFKSDKSKMNNLKVNYDGLLSINPFNLDLNIYLTNYRISKLLNINSIVTEFIKSELLFNENISINTSLFIDSSTQNTLFKNAEINFNVVSGKINFDKTMLTNKEIGLLKLSNSNLFFKDNNLIFNSDILIDVKNSDRLFSFLNTNKSLRKDFKNILINLDYHFLDKQIKFNSVKIDNIKTNDELLTIMNGFKGSDLNNFNNSRRLINQLLEAYDG